MSDSYLELMTAIIELLRDDTALNTLINKRIYSELPNSTQEVFPYCHVEIESGDFSAKDFAGMTHNITIKCFSRKSTPQECAQMRSAIYDALNRIDATTLDLATGHMVRCDYSGKSFLFKEDDGVTWQGAIGFIIIIT